jgi:hypothetical protein
VGAAIAVVVVAAIAAVALLAGGSGGSKSAGDNNAGPAPAGDRVVGIRRVRTRGGPTFALALSVPDKAGGGAHAAVPLTMSLLAAQGGGPEKVVQRERLPAPPYRFAKDSYISEFMLAPQPQRAASLDLSWYVHPGDHTNLTCYATLSLAGISLDGCG